MAAAKTSKSGLVSDSAPKGINKYTSGRPRDQALQSGALNQEPARRPKSKSEV